MEIGLEGKETFKSTVKFNSNLSTIKNVKGITVNTVHGNTDSIDKIIKRLNPEIETMEGAAFFYVCEKENITSLQLRAISNYVEKRNRDAWNIPFALNNLKISIANLIADIK